MGINLPTQIPLSEVYIAPERNVNNVKLAILRLDSLDPVVSGNKWFKLSENLKQAQSLGKKTIVTFGGAFSNHLVATAGAAHMYGFNAIGLVRGYHGFVSESETLTNCKKMGMQLVFLSRDQYAQKADTEFLEVLQQQYPDAYIIPEGGDNENGIKGAATIAQYLPDSITHCALAIGTGTTFCGLAYGLKSDVSLLGFPVLKNAVYLSPIIQDKIGVTHNNWHLFYDYHFGGFGKYTHDLIDFMNQVYTKNAIPLDFVYTAKMLFGVMDLINKNYFDNDAHVVCVHTGGLQGNSTLKQKLVY